MRAFIFLFLIACFASADFCDIEFSNGHKIENLPFANTDSERTKGLSNMTDIGNGMLFFWDTPQYVHFWMRDTLIPLSVGFFDKNHTLFQIEDMEPLSLRSHSSVKSVIFALELVLGGFQEQNITLGTKITKINCPK